MVVHPFAPTPSDDLCYVGVEDERHHDESHQALDPPKKEKIEEGDYGKQEPLPAPHFMPCNWFHAF